MKYKNVRRRNDIILSAYLLRIYLTALWERHGHIVRIHDLPSQSAHDRRVDMMTEGDFFRKAAKIAVTDGAIIILRRILVTSGKFQRCKSGIECKMEKRFG